MRELLDDFSVGQVWEVSDACMECHEGCRTYRTNATTSRAEGLFKSPRNSINARTRDTCVVLEARVQRLNRGTLWGERCVTVSLPTKPELYEESSPYEMKTRLGLESIAFKDVTCLVDRSEFSHGG